MNELIEKLLDEAELDIVWNQDNPDYKWVEGSEESLLKFAELIVRECLEQVDKVDAMLEDNKEKVGVAWVGLAIAKHFGVEK